MDNVTSIFKTRLKELRGCRNQTQVAKEIGISRSALSYYESGERTPDINILYLIAQYYDVTADYLLGLSNIPKPDIDSAAISNKLGLNQCAIDNLSQIVRSINEAPSNNSRILPFLLLQTINMIISNSKISESLFNALFAELMGTFIFFYNIPDNPCSQGALEFIEEICIDEFYGSLRGYSEGKFNFQSDTYLLGLTHELQTLRDALAKDISEILISEVESKNLTPLHGDVTVCLKNYFNNKSNF